MWGGQVRCGVVRLGVGWSGEVWGAQVRCGVVR